MDKLVVDHSYALGIAWDKTQYRNHGLVYQAVPGTSYFQSSFAFEPGRTSPGSTIVVRPSPSLTRLGAIRVRAMIYTLGSGGSARQNIVEGHISFAFILNNDFSLEATFFDPNNQWVGLRTPPNVVAPNRWYEVEYWYDGISAAEILVNGVRAASSFTPGALLAGPMNGPVRGIGPFGIAIGHWPDPDDRYTFNGYIRNTQVYKRDDLQDLAKLLDPCCLQDLSYWYDLGKDLRKKGYSREYARDILDQLIALGSQVAADVRGGNEQRTEDYNHVIEQLLYALMHRGSVPLGPSLRQAVEWVSDNADLRGAPDLEAQARRILDQLPFNQEELLDLGDRLCFGDFRKTVETVVKEIDADPKWRERHHKHE